MYLLGFDATYPGRYVSTYCGSTLLTEEAGSSVTSVIVYQTTRRYNLHEEYLFTGQFMCLNKSEQRYWFVKTLNEMTCSNTSPSVSRSFQVYHKVVPVVLPESSSLLHT
jgi:hypothetical protein